MYLTVKNAGSGTSHETQANMRNLTGDGLLLRAGRFDVSNMKPGDVRKVAFTFDVLDNVADGAVKVDISVHDRDLRVGSGEKLTIPLTTTGLAVDPAGGRVRATVDAEVRGEPLDRAPAVATLAKGSVLDRLGTFGEYTKVDLGEERFAFVETKKLEDVNAPVKVGLAPLLTRSPPVLEVRPASLATRDQTVRIEGVATDGDRVLDAYVFVGANKVFYQSNQSGPDPRRMQFSFEAELRPGVNVITVVARENDDNSTRRTMVVRRDGPAGEVLATPKLETFGADWEFGEEP